MSLFYTVDVLHTSAKNPDNVWNVISRSDTFEEAKIEAFRMSADTGYGRPARVCECSVVFSTRRA